VRVIRTVRYRQARFNQTGHCTRFLGSTYTTGVPTSAWPTGTVPDPINVLNGSGLETNYSNTIQKSCVSEGAIENDNQTDKSSGHCTKFMDSTDTSGVPTGAWPTGKGPLTSGLISDTCPARSLTWTALLTQSVSIMSGGDGEGHVSSDLIPHGNFSPRGSPRGSPRARGSDVNGRDYSPDAERAGKHYSTDPGVCVSYIETKETALLTQSSLLTQSA
jgi:hypothetical protein